MLCFFNERNTTPCRTHVSFRVPDPYNRETNLQLVPDYSQLRIVEIVLLSSMSCFSLSESITLFSFTLVLFWIDSTMCLNI